MTACAPVWSRPVLPPDNLYSQFVAWSKIILPLVALALLSTMFLFARSTVETTIPYAEIEEIAREPRISEPQFAGIAADGSVVSVAARTMRPIAGEADRFDIDTLRVEVDAVDGSRIEVTAGDGEIDGAARVVRLSGLTRLSTSSGYVMETAGMTADLNTGRIQSLGPLAVQAPYGSLTAGQLVVETPEGDTTQLMVFTGGVRLIYQPQQ